MYFVVDLYSTLAYLLFYLAALALKDTIYPKNVLLHSSELILSIQASLYTCV